MHQRCSVRVRRRPDGGPLREAFAPGGPSAPLVFHLGNTRFARADRVFALSPDRFTLAAGRDGSSRGCAHPKQFSRGFRPCGSLESRGRTRTGFVLRAIPTGAHGVGQSCAGAAAATVISSCITSSSRRLPEMCEVIRAGYPSA